MGTPKNALILKGLFDLPSKLKEVMRWETLRDGVKIHWLYRSGPDGPSAALIKFDPGARVPLHEHCGYEHIFVLSGSQMDQNGFLETGTLMIHPPGFRHSVVSEEGCVVLAIYERPVEFLDS